MRLLDVGCGWGSFAVHVAKTYGVSVVGITLSAEQARYAQEHAANTEVADRVEIRMQDYRDVSDGPYDAIASIGMAEHVGLHNLPQYASTLYELLRPRGRLLNHAIARRPGEQPEQRRSSFITRYVFPDGELVPLSTMVDVLESAGWEVRDVESLREHYALTLRAWVRNLEKNWNAAVGAVGSARARIWMLYMASCALSFEANRIGVNQILAVRPDQSGDSAMPRNREGLRSSSPTTEADRARR